MVIRVNIGCGRTPTQGWLNLDNSMSLRLLHYHFFILILQKLNLINRSQLEFIQFARENKIVYGDATKGLKLQGETVDVIYSSHMFEHLDKIDASIFLVESFRVLRPGGIIRIVVPDIKKFISIYNETEDADDFIEATYLCVPRPRSFKDLISFFLVGARHHQWMYDGRSLSKILMKFGFINSVILSPGQTKIMDYGLLDLWERSTESIFVEAMKPDLPPINRTSHISKKSITLENDGHENKQIQRRADHWFSAVGRSRHADQGTWAQARLQ